jgi:hypothetical protein
MQLLVIIMALPYLSGFQLTSPGLNMHASPLAVFTSHMSKDLTLFENISKGRLAMTWTYSELMYTLK